MHNNHKQILSVASRCLSNNFLELASKQTAHRSDRNNWKSLPSLVYCMIRSKKTPTNNRNFNAEPRKKLRSLELLGCSRTSRYYTILMVLLSFKTCMYLYTALHKLFQWNHFEKVNCNFTLIFQSSSKIYSTSSSHVVCHLTGARLFSRKANRCRYSRPYSTKMARSFLPTYLPGAQTR